MALKLFSPCFVLLPWYHLFYFFLYSIYETQWNRGVVVNILDYSCFVLITQTTGLFDSIKQAWHFHVALCFLFKTSVSSLIGCCKNVPCNSFTSQSLPWYPYWIRSSISKLVLYKPKRWSFLCMVYYLNTKSSFDWFSIHTAHLLDWICVQHKWNLELIQIIVEF